MNKKWYLKQVELGNVELSVDPVIDKILYKRGIRGKEQIDKYLYGGLDRLYNPFLLNNMEAAVNRIITAVNNKEKVIIYGDYDVDGITSTALLYHYFKYNLNLEVDYYLPNRMKEGYGLNINAVRKIIAEGYQLLITVDCGITAVNEVQYAASRGLDVIVTDHHRPGAEIPTAVAVINPHLPDDKFPFKGLAGVGVAYKVCQALEKKYHNDQSKDLIEYLDLVALGSVADIVPLQDENRLLVKEGLEILRSSNKPGLKILLKRLGLDKGELSAGQIGFIAAPPLNAAGRMQDPEMGLRLLITEDTAEAEAIVDKLITINRQRQAEEEEIFKDALIMLEGVDLEKEKGIVLASEKWHEGVIGIVASRLVEKFYRPTILIALDEQGVGKASCRSINNLNLFETLQACQDNLIGFGGHAMAAGLSIEKGKIDQFRQEFNDYVGRVLSKEDFIPKLVVDVQVETAELTRNLFDKIELMKPFGAGNPKPNLLLSNVILERVYQVGKQKKHLKFSLENGIEGIGFGYGELEKDLKQSKVDLVFSLSLNKWNGREQLQINLSDINLRGDENYYPVNYDLGKIMVADKRGCQNKIMYLEHLIADRRKTAVYLNNLSVYEEYKRSLPDNYLYSQKEIEEYAEVDNGMLFFTNTNLSSKIVVDDLIFLSLPFSINEMAKMVNYFNPDFLHLLFGEKELAVNRDLIKTRIPNDILLRELYLILQREKKRGDTSQLLVQEEILNKSGYTEVQLNTGLEILSELNLIKYDNNIITVLTAPQNRLDLSESIRYNEVIGVNNQFNELSNLAYADNIFKLVKRLHLFKEVKE